jgi:hypothetical protein
VGFPHQIVQFALSLGLTTINLLIGPFVHSSDGRLGPPNRRWKNFGRSDRRAFDPHGWMGAAIANHSVISPATASLESDVDDWIHMPAVTLVGRFVAVHRASR